MNKKLSLAVLIVLFLVGYAYGDEDVYYFTQTEAVGFLPNKTNDSYKQTTFALKRFKMKYEDGLLQEILWKYDPCPSVEIFDCCGVFFDRTVDW